MRKRECTSIVIVYSLVSESRLDTSSTMMPPPSTVSIVRASRLGVSASKSCVAAGRGAREQRGARGALGGASN